MSANSRPYDLMHFSPRIMCCLQDRSRTAVYLSMVDRMILPPAEVFDSIRYSLNARKWIEALMSCVCMESLPRSARQGLLWAAYEANCKGIILCALNRSLLQGLHGVLVTCSHEVSSHMGMAPESGNPPLCGMSVSSRPCQH